MAAHLQTGKPKQKLPACPTCGSTNVYAKKANDEPMILGHEVVGNWRGFRCRRCGADYSEKPPAYKGQRPEGEKMQDDLELTPEEQQDEDLLEEEEEPEEEEEASDAA